MGVFDFLKKKGEKMKVTADIITPKEVIKFYHWEDKEFKNGENLERLYKEVEVLARYAKSKGLTLKIEFTIDRPPDDVVKKLLDIGDASGVFIAVVWNDKVLVVR